MRAHASPRPQPDPGLRPTPDPVVHAPVGEDELFRRWCRDRDSRARDELVKAYMPLTRRLARRYHGSNEPLDDLLQVASVGLLRAFDRFDPDRGVSFTSFAVPTILGELKRYFRDLGWSVHVPRGAQDLARQVEGAQQRLTTDSGRVPTVRQIANYLELSTEEVLQGLEAAAGHHSVSLDMPGRDDPTQAHSSAGEQLAWEDERFARVDAGLSIAVAARGLSERERRVLARRFIEDQTQSEIAAAEGVSQMQISRVLRQAIDRLSDAVEAAETEIPSR